MSLKVDRFTSFPQFLFQSEHKCEILFWKLVVFSTWIKFNWYSYMHNKNVALRVALKRTLKYIRKWPILLLFCSYHHHNHRHRRHDNHGPLSAFVDYVRRVSSTVSWHSCPFSLSSFSWTASFVSSWPSIKGYTKSSHACANGLELKLLPYSRKTTGVLGQTNTKCHEYSLLLLVFKILHMLCGLYFQPHPAPLPHCLFCFCFFASGPFNTFLLDLLHLAVKRGRYTTPQQRQQSTNNVERIKYNDFVKGKSSSFHLRIAGD